MSDLQWSLIHLAISIVAVVGGSLTCFHLKPGKLAAIGGLAALAGVVGIVYALFALFLGDWFIAALNGIGWFIEWVCDLLP